MAASCDYDHEPEGITNSLKCLWVFKQLLGAVVGLHPVELVSGKLLLVLASHFWLGVLLYSYPYFIVSRHLGVVQPLWPGCTDYEIVPAL
jgi:hypothetical protein